MEALEVASTVLETQYGTFVAYVLHDGTCAMVLNGTDLIGRVLVRVHSECLFGDAFESEHCDCGHQKVASLQSIFSNGSGVFVYDRSEGRAIGLFAKVQAMMLQESGVDTYEANTIIGCPEDGRDYAGSAKILKHLGVSRLRLLTNNFEKANIMRSHGFDVEVEGLVPKPKTSERCMRYLTAKQRKGCYSTPNNPSLWF